MKHRMLTPGPTPVPEETLLEMAKPVFYHRSAQAKHLLLEVQEDLQYVFCTNNPVLTLTCSGTGAMEAAVVNCVPPGGKVICLSAGRWGERWRNLCKAFGAEPINVTAPYGQPIQPEQLAEALAKHPDVTAVTATLSETATGVRHDIASFGKLAAQTPAVLIVDAISGLGVTEMRTDDWHVDVCVTGSQKALMLPPGLAFASVSDKAWRRIEQNLTPHAFYFDMKKYRDGVKTGETPFTPAITLVRALRASLKRLRAEGIENIWARHARVAAAARAGIAALGLELFAAQPVEGLTVFKVPEGIDGETLLKKLEKGYGFKLAGGQDVLKGKIVRLGHMGYIDYFEVLGAIAALELTLLEMGHPVEVGVGVAAAQAAMGQGLTISNEVGV
ncbi:MAG TPA: alanine--glyoxylate aminotransferase family protein [Gemmataceae bacterium]|nr:alanine--glyoxylate aminotransferase family protein [Gemmataceae bacterium]